MFKLIKNVFFLNVGIIQSTFTDLSKSKLEINNKEIMSNFMEIKQYYSEVIKRILKM